MILIIQDFIPNEAGTAAPYISPSWKLTMAASAAGVWVVVNNLPHRLCKERSIYDKILQRVVRRTAHLRTVNAYGSIIGRERCAFAALPCT